MHTFDWRYDGQDPSSVQRRPRGAARAAHACGLAPIMLALTACSATRNTRPAPSPSVPPPPTWAFQIEPYVWVPSTAGDGSTSTTPPLDIDLVGDLDAALPLAFVALSPDRNVIVLADGFYLRLADDDGSFRTRTEVGMFELGGGVALDPEKRWQAIAGLRYANIGYDVALGSLEGSLGVDWVDPWIGARGEIALDERWSVNLRGDVGGFGVGTQFTWQALALLCTRLGKAISVDLGYRAIGIDFEDGAKTYDVLFHGPIAGLGVSF